MCVCLAVCIEVFSARRRQYPVGASRTANEIKTRIFKCIMSSWKLFNGFSIRRGQLTCLSECVCLCVCAWETHCSCLGIGWLTNYAQKSRLYYNEQPLPGNNSYGTSHTHPYILVQQMTATAAGEWAVPAVLTANWKHSRVVVAFQLARKSMLHILHSNCCGCLRSATRQFLMCLRYEACLNADTATAVVSSFCLLYSGLTQSKGKTRQTLESGTLDS